MIFIVVLIAGKKNMIFAVLKSMMHSSPYIVKKTAGFFSARVTAAVCSVKERDGCLDMLLFLLCHTEILFTLQ